LISAAAVDARAPGVRLTRLENGIAVVTETMPSVRSLSIGLLLDAGPADDPAGREGVAHLAEHLLFQGTSSRSSLDIARFMDAAGGSLGAFTSRDYTCFYATVLDHFRTFALDLFGDLLLNSTFPAASIERHRGAVVAELNAEVEAPGARARAALRRHAWGDHPLGRGITGTEASVGRLSREDVIYFVQENYTPDRLIIAAAGNVDHEDFVAQSRDAFWRLEGSSARGPRRPPIFQGGLVTAPSSGRLSHFAIGLPGPSFAAPDRYEQHAANRILGAGLGSRLFRRVREELGLVYDIGSEVLGYRDAGLWLIEGCCAPGDLIDVLRETFAVLEDFAAGHVVPNEEECASVRSQLHSQHVLGGESTHTRMSRLATQQLYFGGPLGEPAVLAAFDRLDSQAIERFAKTRVGPVLGDVVLSVVDPADSGPRRDALADLIGSLQRHSYPLVH
jgi:predicted Zn-dependent peptidase